MDQNGPTPNRTGNGIEYLILLNILRSDAVIGKHRVDIDMSWCYLFIVVVVKYSWSQTESTHSGRGLYANVNQWAWSRDSCRPMRAYIVEPPILY